MLLRYTTRTFKSRRLDSHQHEAVYGTAAFLNRATSAFPKGVWGESNPSPRPSQGHMQNHYTTDTISNPGWIRTSDPSHVTGMSCPLNDGTVIPRPGFEPGTPRSKRGMMVHFTVGASSGRQGSRTLISVSENRLSRAARPTVSGYLPSVDREGVAPSSRVQDRRRPVGPAAQSVIPDGLEPSLPGCRPGVVAAGPRDHRSSRGGNRTHKLSQALDLAALPTCVLGRQVAEAGFEPASYGL